MEAKKYFKIFIMLFLLITMSCGTEYKVKTIINKDGSCQRSISAIFEKPMGKDFYSLNLPVPIDTTWNLVIEQDTNENGDTIFIHTATKLFKRVEHLNQLYSADTSRFRCLERTVVLKKRFRWFYTFYDYNECINKLFDQEPLSNFLDSAQYSYAMLTDNEKEVYLKENLDSLEAIQYDKVVEKGFEKWIENTIVNTSMDALEESVKNFEDWTLDETEFRKKRDSVIDLMHKQVNLFENDDDVFAAIKRVFGLDSLAYEKLRNEDSFKNYIDKYNFWEDNFTSEEYLNSVAMPGLIIETNSTNITESKEVQWKVGWVKYFTDDYSMFVQSRIVNLWAFWVSGVFIILLIISVFLRRFVKSKK